MYFFELGPKRGNLVIGWLHGLFIKVVLAVVRDSPSFAS